MRTLLFVAVAGLSILACKSKSKGHDHKDLNATFEDPNLDVPHYVKIFEARDRAVFVHRKEIVDALQVDTATAVADVGAGTGFFLEHFAKKVGPHGKVYAVEISPKFLEHIAAKKIPQVEGVLSTDTSVNLPANSIDFAFICDTYHHFDQPAAMMRSIHTALRPGGRVAIIEFTRVEGVTKDEWVLDHVRAGEETFTKEIGAVGFSRIEAPKLPYLEDTYLMMFKK